MTKSNYRKSFLPFLGGAISGVCTNPSKCNVLIISKLKEPLIKVYELEGRVLGHVEAATYLEILIENTLTFTGHIKVIANKANQKLSFLKRTLRGTPIEVWKMAYVSFVRSSLEYASSICDPQASIHKAEIEKNPKMRHPVDFWQTSP